ncbi:hypothetical protein PIB30_023626 [Stylosanthes scabra]|uniref:Disease resistance RPP13-like protein 1 n=1 Tax=Stylosanthes scabra TaxID=79078 RepID=A0ABU6Q931_9FABA|nr:hypothetical protein [Stylosanthes scabra]
MAEALLVGALVSGSISLVLNRLISPEFVNSAVSKNLDRNLVERLRNAFLAADALVADAEQKQFGNKHVKEWLDSLRDAHYTGDDLLDRVEIKAQIRNKVRIRLPLRLNLSVRKMVTKIEEVVKRIEDLQKLKDSLGLKKIPMGNSWRTPTTSLVKGNVYGRDGDQQALMKMLNDNNDHQLSVISIVGMGGVGKTTLAQWLYNNEDLMKGFDLKAWIYVSENFDVVDTTKNVIRGINSGVCSLDGFDLLQHDLKKRLSETKFFIVLDDVWSNDGDAWNSFIIPFQHGRNGSTVLVTTRMENAGPIVQNYNSYPLNGLSDDYCWSIFADNASFPESNVSSELEAIGRKIVQRCDGLPLAAETLGRLLRTKHDVRDWNKILSSDIWEIPITDSKIVPALLISYYHLPAYLKHCFVYSSVYPKGHRFDKNQLILLWMAEDLLRPPKRGETLEEVGCECFDDLVSRLFFKEVNNDDDKYFVMHDLMHDLATCLAGKFYCRLSEEPGEEMTRTLTRHLSYGRRMFTRFYSSSRIECLRTFLNTNHTPFLFNTECTAAVHGILSKNKYLRVLSFHRLSIFPDLIANLIHLRYLDLSWSNFEVLPQSLCNLCNLQTLKLRRCSSLTMLPSSLGELIHLRYLDLSRSAIETLPESLCKLSYLQTLKLEECSKLTMLPNGMYNLVNLWHLDIRGTPLKEMPKGMGKWKQLHILSDYIVGEQEENGIQELGGLLSLHGSFAIQKLENVLGVNQARSARIIDKKHIDELLLEWSSGNYIVSNIQMEGYVLDSLRPHTGLKELRIKGYKGIIFPDWLGQYSYNNMTSVSLVSCKNCCKLPSLGQLPSLKSLRIEGFSELKCIGDEFYKNEDDCTLHIAPFPSLETLYFSNMPCWELWSLPGAEAFPQLKRLEIRECPMLYGVMVNQILMRIFSSSSDVSKVSKLYMKKYEVSANDTAMTLEGDSLSLKGCEWLAESTFKATIIHHLTSLQEIIIDGFWSVVSFPANWLQKLEIRNCPGLASLWLDAFPNLKNLQIENCSNLESISMSDRPHTALQRLSIHGCYKLVSLTEEGLAAPSLTHLHLKYCDNLDALPGNMDTLVPNLQSLDIQYCPGICRFPEDGLPRSLKKLCMKGYEGLLRGLSSMGKLEALTHLVIDDYNCGSRIKSFPEVGLLPHLPSLTTLEIIGFDNLETLECNELLRLTSLQHLHIKFCEKLEKIEGEKLPLSLLLLEIKGSPLLKSCMDRRYIGNRKYIFEDVKLTSSASENYVGEHVDTCLNFSSLLTFSPANYSNNMHFVTVNLLLGESLSVALG